MLAGCYTQPPLDPKRPLRCTVTATTDKVSDTADECPKGYACQAGVCGPTSCERTSECPAPLSCTNRGCVALGDGGAADVGIQIPNVPDGGEPDGGIADVALPSDVPAVTIDGGQD
jgi:hypothetical protein